MKATKILICIEDSKIRKAVCDAFAQHAGGISETLLATSSMVEATEALQNDGADLLVIQTMHGASAPQEVNEMLSAARVRGVRIAAVIENLNQARTAILLGVDDSIAWPLQGADLLKVLLMTVRNQRPEIRETDTDAPPSAHLVIQKHKKTSLLKYDEILLLRAEGSYTEIICQSGEVVRVSKVIKTFDDQLRAAGFVRLGRSYLLNTVKIKEVQADGNSGGYIVFHSGLRMYISHMLRKRLLNLLMHKENRRAV